VKKNRNENPSLPTCLMDITEDCQNRFFCGRLATCTRLKIRLQDGRKSVSSQRPILGFLKTVQRSIPALINCPRINAASLILQSYFLSRVQDNELHSPWTFRVIIAADYTKQVEQSIFPILYIYIKALGGRLILLSIGISDQRLII